MESLRQYTRETVSKLSESAGKLLAAPLKMKAVRIPLKQTIKGGILMGRWSLNALEGPRKELANLFKEAKKETKPAESAARGKRISIKDKTKKEDDLTNQSLESLYEMAQQYDVRGRSEMNKKELIEAIRRKRTGSQS